MALILIDDPITTLPEFESDQIWMTNLLSDFESGSLMLFTMANCLSLQNGQAIAGDKKMLTNTFSGVFFGFTKLRWRSILTKLK